MITAGLTGLTGAGKSTLLEMFADAGAMTWSADNAVHRLYRECRSTMDLVETSFPGSVRNGMVDRTVLSGLVMNDAQALDRLEEIVHPAVRKERQKFLEAAGQAGAGLSVLDIPLLFETGQDRDFDCIIVVTAPEKVLYERILARQGMTREKASVILERQMPDSEKRSRADYVVNTDRPVHETRCDVDMLYRSLCGPDARSCRSRP